MAKGGAWKVAYADFVTAMMALFMVLWIVGAEQELLENLQEYFRNPPTPFLDRGSGLVLNFDEAVQRPGDVDEVDLFFSQADPKILAGLVNELYRLLKLDPEDEKRPVDVTVTSDGLRLVLFDRGDLPLFVRGSSEFAEWGEFMMQNLSWILARFDFSIVIDGHTARNDEPASSYGAWELSADRANAVRRALEHYALDPAMINRVSGYGSTRPLEGRSEESESHQRITISLSLNGPIDFQPEKSAYGITP